MSWFTPNRESTAARHCRKPRRRLGASARLFGFFGRAGLDHLPYQTADGRYDPAPSIGSSKGELRPAEFYSPSDRIEQPTLAQMTEASLTVLAAEPDPAIRPVRRGGRRRLRAPRQQSR